MRWKRAGAELMPNEKTFVLGEIPMRIDDKVSLALLVYIPSVGCKHPTGRVLRISDLQQEY
jgi:hypothetical protein